MRISTDGFIDTRDERRVRTPGNHDSQAEPLPEEEALSFLLSHSFTGHRRMVRPLSSRERRKLRIASWAGSIGERMALLGQVWRGITAEVLPPRETEGLVLVQVVVTEGEWAYPLYLEGEVTRVSPEGGLPLAELREGKGVPLLDLRRMKASA